MTKGSGNWTADHQRAAAIRLQYELHGSAIEGLYVQFDKLTKKAPGDHLTELALETVNDAIRDSKTLLRGDPYVDRVKEFDPAGETPQNSDVLLVLSTLRTALERFRLRWLKVWSDAGLRSV